MRRVMSSLPAVRRIAHRGPHHRPRSVPANGRGPDEPAAVCRAPSAQAVGLVAALGVDRIPLGTPGECHCEQPVVLDELYGWMHVKTDVAQQDLLQVLAVLEETK